MMLCFILEILVCYDYWYTFFCYRYAFVLIVFATVGLIATILVNTYRLLRTSLFNSIEQKNQMFRLLNLHILFYIPVLWLGVLNYGQLEISLTECHHGPAAAHFYILLTIIWFPAATL